MKRRAGYVLRHAGALFTMGALHDEYAVFRLRSIGASLRRRRSDILGLVAAAPRLESGKYGAVAGAAPGEAGQTH
jgi:hypothetical protein